MSAPLRTSLSVSTFSVALLFAGCGGGGSSAPSPTVLNVNNSMEPASPVDLAIEVNGSGFQGAPGQVVFTQGTNVSTVTPDVAGWSDTGIVVTVPSSGSEGAFTVPGTVMVSVLTSSGSSTEVAVELVAIPVFSNGDVQWATTTALPTALRGHRAAPFSNTPTSAYVVVTGGNDGTNNLSTVLTNTLADDGQVGTTWTATTSLPVPRAHHGMVSAHPGNSMVSSGSFVYVIGGQENQADAPGGTNTVYFASVSTVDGSVGTWSQTTALPVPLVGPAVTLYNNYVYVVGGLLTDGTPSSAVYSAALNSDGTLGSWGTETDYPVGVSFAAIFAFGGNLYVVGGDPGNSTDPNEQAEGADDVRLAPVLNGTVGSWVSTTKTLKRRAKHIVWPAFGQILVGEGVYQGGSQELVRNTVASDGTLPNWQSITNATQRPQADVYNTASLVSPIRPLNGGPRFLLLGGQVFSATPPGALTSTVYYNTAP